MKHLSKKAATALLAAVFALTMAAPALSFAQSEAVPATETMTGLVNETCETHATDEAQVVSASTTGAATETAIAAATSGQDEPRAQITVDGTAEPAPGQASAELTAAGDCTATIRYMENPWEDDPDQVLEEDGRVLLGTHTVTGLHEGDVLHAWDYVVDIPGHFFFDGWPLDLTVSSDPAQNVMTLVYVKLWDCEYTVNYYVMDGADLTADNWSDALKPEGVTFTKVASETFDNQIFDKLVKGDAYEYQVDGMYVIDTYPAQIRVGLEPDDNVINVLYTTSYSTLPDDAEVFDGVPGETTTPDDTPLPDDTTFDKDEIIEVLPDGAGPGDEVYEDFVGNVVRPGGFEVTDEMLQHPVNKEQAELTAQAYATGLQQNSGLVQTGDQLPWLIGVLVMGAAIVALAIGVVVLSRRNKKTEN